MIFGPGVSTLRVRAGQLTASYRAAMAESSISFEALRELLVLGCCTLTGEALQELSARDIRVIFADDGGRPLTELCTVESDPDPAAAAAQLRTTADPSWRLGLARRLVWSKIRNYAALADATGPASREGIAAGLRFDAERALNASTLEQLRGIEGAAGARWYGYFASRLPRWCRFERRVAPDATDPANILLNMGFSALHRQVLLAVRMAGLLPAAGVLHEVRAGHAALASDLQEPFRHLVDRVVMAVVPTLKPSHFQPAPPGARFAIQIAPDAARRAVACFHAAFARPCLAAEEGAASTYLTHIHLSARRLKRHLLDRSVVFTPFVHGAPTPPLPGGGNA